MFIIVVDFFQDFLTFYFKRFSRAPVQGTRSCPEENPEISSKKSTAGSIFSSYGEYASTQTFSHVIMYSFFPGLFPIVEN